MYEVVNKSKRMIVCTLYGGNTLRVPARGVTHILDEERNSPELKAIEAARHVVVRKTEVKHVAG